MAKFFVDQTEIVPPPGGLTSLDQILRHVEEAVLAPNTVIRQIQVDGSPLVGDEYGDASVSLCSTIEDRKTIEIFTGAVWQVAEDSIGEARAYLDRITTLTPSLATSFQVHPGPEAFESLRQLYEGFYWLNLLIDRLEATFGIHMGSLSVSGVPVAEHHRRFIEVLKQLVEAQERQDFVFIADLLEYEVLPLVPIWKEWFEVLAGEVRKTHGEVVKDTTIAFGG